jgi:hypothetical protein
MIYKTLHRKLKIEQHELTKNRGVNSCVPKGLIDFDFWCLYILSVLLYITASDYIFRIFWSLYNIVCPSLYYGFWLHLSHLLVIIYCLPFFILRLLITSFASFGYYVLSVLLYITASDYIFRIFWLLYIVCPSLYYGFWLHLSHLLVII